MAIFPSRSYQHQLQGWSSLVASLAQQSKSCRLSMEKSSVTTTTWSEILATTRIYFQESKGMGTLDEQLESHASSISKSVCFHTVKYILKAYIA